MTTDIMDDITAALLPIDTNDTAYLSYTNVTQSTTNPAAAVLRFNLLRKDDNVESNEVEQSYVSDVTLLYTPELFSDLLALGSSGTTGAYSVLAVVIDDSSFHNLPVSEQETQSSFAITSYTFVVVVFGTAGELFVVCL
eukprot:GHVS01067930.1.p1 GENE.GHVS01067930.1~~GHVS01067930.1.p1  ORF type:complete len:139 (+),score=15.84 GHVS01067930.1:146-562(+)